jgi:hypothetical protein
VQLEGTSQAIENGNFKIDYENAIKQFSNYGRNKRGIDILELQLKTKEKS